MADTYYSVVDKKRPYTPLRIKGRAINFGAGQDGENFCLVFRFFFIVKSIDKCLEKTGRATKKVWSTGETEISPVLLYGGGCMIFYGSILLYKIDLFTFEALLNSRPY